MYLYDIIVIFFICLFLLIFTYQLIICGQALSHVVKLTVMDIIEDWKNNNKKPEDMILLTDCKG